MNKKFLHDLDSTLVGPLIRGIFMHNDNFTAVDMKVNLDSGRISHFLQKRIEHVRGIHSEIKSALVSNTFTNEHIMLARHLNIKHVNANRSIDSRALVWWPPEHYRRLCAVGSPEEILEARTFGLGFAWWHSQKKTSEEFYSALALCHPPALAVLSKMCKGTSARIHVIYLMMLLGDKKAEADYAYAVNAPNYLLSVGNTYARMRYYDLVGGRIDQYWDLAVNGCKKAYKRAGMLQLDKGEYDVAAITFGCHYPKLAMHAGLKEITIGTISISHHQKYILVSITQNTSIKDFTTAALHLKDAIELMFIAPEEYHSLIKVSFKDKRHVIY